MCLDDCDFPLPAVGERRRGGHSEKRRVKAGGWEGGLRERKVNSSRAFMA